MTNTAVGSSLNAVEKTQTAQGATLHAVSKNEQTIKAALGAVQGNQKQDEKSINNLNDLGRTNKDAMGTVKAGISGLNSKYTGVWNQEEGETAKLAKEHVEQ